MCLIGRNGAGLKQTGRDTGFGLIGIIVWIPSFDTQMSQISMANGYLSATTDALRTAYFVQVNTVDQCSFFLNYYVLRSLLYVAVLTLSVVMLRRVFVRIVAYLGIAVALLGLVLAYTQITDFVTPVLLLPGPSWWVTDSLHSIG